MERGFNNILVVVAVSVGTFSFFEYGKNQGEIELNWHAENKRVLKITELILFPDEVRLLF